MKMTQLAALWALAAPLLPAVASAAPPPHNPAPPLTIQLTGPAPVKPGQELTLTLELRLTSSETGLVSKPYFLSIGVQHDREPRITVRSTGIGRPRFWERARYYGEEKRLAAAIDASEVAAV